MSLLPEPKSVANVLRDLFKSKAEREKEAEQERDNQISLGKARIRQHIGRQQLMERRLNDLARRALSLNDEARFRAIGKQLLWTRQDIQRWERYSLSLEMLEARRDQARAFVDLLKSVQAMSESMSSIADPAQVNQMQRQMEEGLARASSLDERMSVMMEAMDSALESGAAVEESALDNLQGDLSGEIARSESAQFDSEIEEGLRKIREQLKADKNSGRTWGG